MTARLCLLSATADRRISLVRTLSEAGHEVTPCATPAEARLAVSAGDPAEVLLIDAAGPGDPALKLASWVGHGAGQTSCLVIAPPLAASRRLALLRDGAADVLDTPLPDAFLLGRIRALIRARAQSAQLAEAEAATTGFGFAAPPPGWTDAGRVMIVAADPFRGARLKSDLGLRLDRTCNLFPLEQAGALTSGQVPVPDLLVIDAVGVPADAVGQKIGSLVSTLRSHRTSQDMAILVQLGRDAIGAAGLVLDLGASDVVPGPVETAELALRARGLLAAKVKRDRARREAEAGLRAALRDSLTGLHNRRFAEAQAARLAARARETGQPLAVLLIDIDRFKEVNDRFGHEAGDKVLADVAQRLRQNASAADVVARIGGEEFLVIMPETGLRQARAAAERLRRLIAARPVDLGRDRACSVTVSIGVASLPARDLESDSLSLGDLIRPADAALYAAKAGGRDMVSEVPAA